jgi:hypothetical protein
MMYAPLDANSLIHALSEIDDWLQKKGLAGNDRIRTYKSNIIEMAEADSRGDPQQTYEAVAAGGRLAEVLASYFEGIEFVDTIMSLRAAGIDIPSEELRKVVSGPADASLENERSNQGRNFMFELVFAAMAARAGLVPEFGGGADIIFSFQDRLIRVECKRVMSVNKIEQRIRDGARQLRNPGPSGCGLLAVSISRTINPGATIWEVPSVSEIDLFLESELHACIRRFEPLLDSLSHRSLSGVVFYISSPMFVRGVGFTPAARGMMYGARATPDAALLQALSNVLRPGMALFQTFL